MKLNLIGKFKFALIKPSLLISLISLLKVAIDIFRFPFFCFLLALCYTNPSAQFTSSVEPSVRILKCNNKLRFTISPIDIPCVAFIWAILPCGDFASCVSFDTWKNSRLYWWTARTLRMLLLGCPSGIKSRPRSRGQVAGLLNINLL